MENKLMLIAMLMPLMLLACREPEAQRQFPTTYEELSKRGHAMCRQGNYLEGLKLLQEANDVLAAMPPDSINPEGAVMLLGNIANLYIRIGLFDDAKQVNSEAMDIAARMAPDRCPELWRMRSIIYENTGQPDSVFVCLLRAKDMCNKIKSESFRKLVEKRMTEGLWWFFIENHNFAPDSIPVAKSALELIEAEDSATVGRVDGVSATNRFLIGRAYVLLGDYSYGISIMEKALDLFKQRNDTESVEWGLQLLAKSYASAGDRRLLDIYAEASALHDTMMQRRRDDLLLGMDFKYRTSQLKNEKSALKNEVRAKRQRYAFISVILVLIIVVLVSFIVIRNRHNRRQLKLKQQNIDTLLAERIALNARIEELNEVLDGNNAETKRNELIQSILLERDDEQRFRKIFNDLHPGFIDRLRREYPELTAGNELLCMLIAVNRRNEEIALALGISRESVVTSRYRLRVRFNLSKDTDLNDFIQSRL